MTILWEGLQALEIQLETRTLPPPYRHQIHAKVANGPSGWTVKFQLRFLDREGLSEEELLEEGFTGEDNFAWEGNLPDGWVTHLQTSLAQSTFPHDQGAARQKEPLIELTGHYPEGQNLQAVPAETGNWEYLLQEFMQALYELAGYERPLELAFRQVTKNAPITQINLHASFASRTAEVQVENDNSLLASHIIGWEEVKEIMKRIYQFEFDILRAKPQPPKKRGMYLFLGEGGWLPLPEALISTTKEEPDPKFIQDWFLQFKL
ncbi:MAG TPA: hypothetical protein DCE41_10075 [Cytophagales bacterium]|nr:hypothetical protein [Cytophagales bacterium]HAA22089.1 hypothetical protein [Cytophagales bacterium]HAP59507.1 hypothetical protein [Cytophagales bacterium]